MTVRNDSSTNGTLSNRLKQKQMYMQKKPPKQQNNIEFCSIKHNFSTQFKEKLRKIWVRMDI